MVKYFVRLLHASFLAIFIFSVIPYQLAQALPVLSITPLTWNVIGLDSNNVNVGPNNFPVGARVCNTSSDAATNLVATFVWDDGLNAYSGNPYINLRSGSLSSISLSSLAGGTPSSPSCYDFYFEVTVTRNALAYNQTRDYHITLSATGVSTISTPTPREIFVEHLISQNRNSTDLVKLDGTTIAAGGTMTLLVGNTYTIDLYGSTATQGYNQLEDFINFPNTIFQILSVDSTYSANSSGYVANTSDKLYADACLWDNNPNSPTYRSCIGSDGKTGGTITTSYTVKVIGGAGTTQALNTLIYDFSGSSYHYNSDFSTGVRYATIISPLSMTKSFSPVSITSGGTSTLSIAITNSSSSAVTGVSLTDPLPTSPAQMSVASTPAASTSAGCLTPVFSPAGGATSITYSGGVAANSTCTLSVNVTAATIGTYINTTGNLFINGSDTGVAATSNLTVASTVSPAGLCSSQTLATWTFPTGFNVTTPSPTSSIVTATASTTTTNSAQSATGNPLPAWTGDGFNKNVTITGDSSPYFQFAVNTSGYSSATISVDYKNDTNWGSGGAGTPVFYIWSSTTGGAGSFTNIFTSSTFTSSYQSALNKAAASTGATTTYFRINAVNATNTNSDMEIDNVVVKATGCSTAIQPTITKAFSPNPIGINGTSTLTFTLSNTNSANLTGAAFSDSLPSGLKVASTPSASTTCAGASFAPVANDTTLSFSSGTIPANGSCTVQVNVTGATAGTYNNTSGFISTTESGTNTGAGGSASASLTVLAPPAISKSFSPNPIYTGSTSTLTFTITNPNASTALSGVAFTDTFPAGLTRSVVPTTPQCGGTVSSTSTSVTLSGGTLAAGASCTVSIVTTAATTGSYANTSGTVSAIISGVTYNGNTASDTLGVEAVTPAISILKQVSSGPAGPWSSTVNVSPGGNVYYRLTIENIGDVALSPVNVTDPTLNISSCIWPSTLPVGTASVDPTASCIVGPVVASSTIGSFPNTATAHGTYSGTVYDSAPSTATYVTSSLTLVKNLTSVNGSGATTSFSAAGDVLAYSYTITNSGTTPLTLPVTVTDSNTTVSCPSVDTSGNQDGTLAAGENIVCTASYTVTAFDMSVGSVTNTASATIGATTSNTDRETVYRNQPDLVISKTNNTSGYAYKGVSFNWILTVSNNGPQAATFTSGQTIFSDQLPAGATYGSPVVGSPALITNSANISCSINGSKLLACTASGADVIIGATTGSFAVTVPVTPTAAGSLVNSSAVVDPNSNISESNEGNNTGSDSVNVSELSAPTISKSFTPATITSGGSSTITFTLSNPNANALTNASFSDSLSNMPVDGDQSVLGTCAGANSNSLLDGDTSLSLSGITIPASSSCTVTVIVTSTTLGVNPNTTSGVTTAQTAIGTASNTANLTVLGPAAIAKAFNPATIVTGGTSTITFTLSNPNASGLTGASFSDTLSNMSISGAQNAGGTCTGATSNSFADAATALTFSGISIPASSSCTVTVIVTSTTLGVNPNTTSGVTTTQTTIGSPAASVDLTVTAPDLRLEKTSASSTVIAGGTVSFTLTVKNIGDAATNGTITVMDVLPTGLTVPPATPSPFTPGGTNGANWSCAWSGQVITCTSNISISATTGQSVFSFTANVDSAATGDLVNQAKVGGGGDPDNNSSAPTVDETKACVGNTPEGCATRTETVSTQPDLSLAKDDGTAVLTAGGSTTYAMTVTNSGISATSGLITIVDVLPTGLTIPAGTLSPFTPTGTNGGDWSCTWSGQVFTCTSSASIAATNGTSTFNLTVDVDTNASGALLNKAQVGGGGDSSIPNPPTQTTVNSCTAVNSPEGCATDSDTVLTAPSISKSFSPNPISVSGVSTLTFSITNANTGTALTGVAFTDSLPAGLQVAATPNIGTSGCGSPTFAPSAGATSLTFSGGTIAASGTCTVSVDVTATTSGTKNNTSGTVTSTNGGTGNTASDSLTVNSLSAPSIVKSFDDATIPLNGSTVLNFTISNPTANTVSLTGVGFTDNLPAGLVISTPNGLTGSCGGGTITATAGATSVSLSGATLAANASCTFTVNVTGNTAGLKNNSVTVSSTNGGTGNTSNASVTVVSPPSISKSFSPDSISVGGLSTLTFTITNANTGTALTGVAFTDSLPSGLQVAATPNVGTSGCGSPTFAPAAGATSLTFNGGTIAASGTCTINVDVTATTGGTKNNTSGNVSSTNGGTGNTASDSLSVADTVDLSLGKDVDTTSPSLGDNVVFTITVTNHSTTTDATNIEITDVLPAGLTFVSSNASLGTFADPTWIITTLAANSSETLQLTATVTQVGSITNFTQITASDQSDPDSTPNNNTTQTPAEDDEASVTIGGLFDPPSAIKSFNVVSGIPELEFRMVWINSGNTLAINTQVTDTIPAGTTYVSGPVCSPQGSSTTTSCTYNSGTNSIFWQGSIGPDDGNLTEGTAANEVVITFRVTVNNGVNQVFNTASSVTDLDGNESFTNDDPIVSVVDSNQVVWNRNTPGTSSLPSTGFAPSVNTVLPEQPAESAYLATDILLEIPKLKVKLPIVGVPFKDGKWDVTWLDKNAGWLNGTAFPSWKGNSVLTGHVGLANGTSGPFANLGSLVYGDQVIIHVSGQKYIYEVRTSRLVSPSSVSSVIKHEELPWVTLITCKSYNEKTGEYTYRTVVRAVLIKVLDE